jgi:hypothetical protein
MTHSGATEREPDPAGAERPGRVELAVGIATRNQADTIGALVESIARGLAVGFAGVPVRLIHADGGSQDGTVERAREALGDADRWLTQVRFERDPLALPAGSGFVDSAALRSILTEACRIDTPACVVLDATVPTVPPAWIERLARPVLADQLDFVAPYYRRHPFDGTITSAIAYPLQRALYGKQVRYPLATDFACSRRFLLSLFPRREAAWPAELGRVGAEAWLATRALTGEFRLGQAFLGVKEAPAAEPADVSEVLPRILGALFLEAERHAATWQKIRRSVLVPLSGAPLTGSPESRALDPGRALQSFRLGERSLQEIWRGVLSPAALLELARLARRPDDGFRFPDPLWARVVYDFALAHRLRVMNRDHLLAAFVPLYQGWLAGFALELGDPDAMRAEERIDALCLRFESEKPYLISRWRWPDRFNP